MAHHGRIPDEAQDELSAQLSDLRDALLERQAALRQPQNQFPEGFFGKEDEGALAIGITAAKGKVVLAFGEPTEWTAFGPDQARELAQLILDRAQECDGISARVRRQS